MAKNTGEGYRKGAIKNREQHEIDTGKTKIYVKVDSETKEPLGVKENEKFKGVRKKQN